MNDIIFRVIIPENKIIFKTLMLKGERGLQGTSIVNIEKTSSIGLIDIYTITLNDGTTYTFEVRNGTNSEYDTELSDISINAVQNRVLKGVIDLINADISNIQDDISTINDNISDINDDIADLNTAIQSITAYDNALSDVSENAVQNKVIKAALDDKADSSDLNDYYDKTEIDSALGNLGASGIAYNNASSGLSATDTQSAIDELAQGGGDIPENATELPISASDSTNTKAYIDSGLSGKADKASTMGTMSSTVGTFARGSLRKLGDIKYCSFCLYLSNSVSVSTDLITLPSGFNASTSLDAVGLVRVSGTDTICDLFISGSKIQYNSSNTVASGGYIFGNFWYI